jgi:hypothetical protein
MQHEWGKEKCIYHIGGKARRKKTTRRRRRKWVENFKIHLRDIGWGGLDWTDLL